MLKTNRLSSLSIFFPFYNDEGTVEAQIEDAYRYGRQMADDLEVIALHGGPSRDHTLEAIRAMQATHPELKIVDRSDNIEGYAVIKHGFSASTKEWVFYTDGDRQYRVEELGKLVEIACTKPVDVVNGYKLKRGDNLVRTLLGGGYRTLSRFIFGLPIRDLDCDFRLIRRKLLNRFELKSADASVLLELVVKLKTNGAVFFEVPVHHYPRSYGHSTYTALSLFREKIIGDLRLWLANFYR